jgi:hypothetical protein
MEQQAFETGSEVRGNNSECYDGDEVLHEPHLEEVIAGGLNPSQVNIRQAMPVFYPCCKIWISDLPPQSA